MAGRAGEGLLAALVAVLSDPAAPGDAALRENWRKMYGQWSAYLSALGARMGLQQADIEDLIQDVLLAISFRWKAYRHLGAKRLLALSRRIMRDKGIDEIRRRDRHRALPLEDLPCEPTAPGASENAGSADGEDRKKHLHAAMEELKRHNRVYYDVLYEHHVEGRSCEGLARTRGCSVKAMKILLQRARDRLRRLLAEHLLAEHPLGGGPRP
jgi:DNA-directed RNA polymerase specialized sigma24 family protein